MTGMILGVLVGAGVGSWALFRELRARQRLAVIDALEHELMTAYPLEEIEAQMRELSGDAPLRAQPGAVSPVAAGASRQTPPRATAVALSVYEVYAAVKASWDPEKALEIVSMNPAQIGQWVGNKALNLAARSFAASRVSSHPEWGISAREISAGRFSFFDGYGRELSVSAQANPYKIANDLLENPHSEIVDSETYQYLRENGVIARVSAQGHQVIDGGWQHATLKTDVQHHAAHHASHAHHAAHHASHAHHSVHDHLGHWISGVLFAAGALHTVNRVRTGEATVNEGGIDLVVDAARVGFSVVAGPAVMAQAAIAGGMIAGPVGSAAAMLLASVATGSLVAWLKERWKYGDIVDATRAVGTQVRGALISNPGATAHVLGRVSEQCFELTAKRARLLEETQLASRYAAEFDVYASASKYVAPSRVGVLTRLHVQRLRQECERVSRAVLQLRSTLLGLGSKAGSNAVEPGPLGELAINNPEFFEATLSYQGANIAAYQAKIAAAPNHPFRFRDASGKPVDSRSAFQVLCVGAYESVPVEPEFGREPITGRFTNRLVLVLAAAFLFCLVLPLGALRNAFPGNAAETAAPTGPSGAQDTLTASPASDEYNPPPPPAPSPAPPTSDEYNPPPPPAPSPPPSAPPPALSAEMGELVPDRTSASSFISNGRRQFAPERAFDGDPSTAWSESTVGPGQGAWLAAHFDRAPRIQRVRILTGYDHVSPNHGDLFAANSHLRRVRLTFDGGHAEEREVGEDQRTIDIDVDVRARTVRVEALDVYPGTRWADLCISEVSIEGFPQQGVAERAPAPEPEAPGDETSSALEALHPTDLSASSSISEGWGRHSPERAFDGDPATAWNESEHGPGDGSWIAAAFPSMVMVERVQFATGHDFHAPRYGDVFPLNSHLRRVRVTFDGGHAIERDVAADERVVVLEGLHARARAVRIEALSVWPGTRWATFCISEIAIAGHP